MSQKYEKLKSLLKELFQLDQPDLDFGLYRIMHAKAGEVTAFLERDLLPQVKAEFGKYKTADKGELEQQLAKAIEQAQSLGADPETLPKVKDLREKLKSDAVDISALEGEVYDHLISFFSRYYSEGDFLSKRRYSRDGRYAIPYDGEEVKLYWANHDQYYIKTSEYLRDYAFRLRPDDDAKPMRVHFRLADAAEGEHGNIKPPNGKDRVFILAAPNPLSLHDDGVQQELVLHFEYRPATLNDWPDDEREGKTKPPGQKDLTVIAETLILSLAAIYSDRGPWAVELAKPHVKPAGEKADYTRLRAHLNRYVARNTFDYFIHKNLGGFLRRELDFYIKNEVMHLDDVESETAPRVEQYLSKIKVIRRIAGKLIAFLAQLEDFQKDLWLKKKFVVETHYCVALKEISDEFMSEIVTNAGQWAEWESLHQLSVLKKKEDDGLFPKNVKLKSPEFLKMNPSLMIDTRHFNADFTARLLQALGDFDGKTDGLLFHSENFQALSLMQARYKERVKCVYIDPPYNTGSDGFDYKDNYKSSTWLSMIADRVSLSHGLLQPDDCFIAMSIDKRQMYDGQIALTNILSEMEFVNGIVNVSNPKGRSDQKHLPTAHDNILLFAGEGSVSHGWHPQDKVLRRYRLQDSEGKYREIDLRKTGDNDLETDRPRMAYAFAYNENSCDLIPLPLGDTKTPNGYFLIWPMKDAETKGCWRWEYKTSKENLIRLIAKYQPQKQQWTVFEKDRLAEDERVFPTSVWDEKPFNSERGSEILEQLGFPERAFARPKPVGLLEYLLEHLGGVETLDFFAGSGTTGHAVINLNREDEDGGRRKFILVEMADYFDTVLLPRLKKVSFTPEWKDGHPNRLATAEEADRGPRILKIVRLESYEDTLNNLDVKRSATQQSLLDTAEAQGADKLREQYLLRYMLKVETRESPSLLNVPAFTDPTLYRLVVKRPGSDESRDVSVDLIETFNWLLGLTVQHIAVPQAFSAQFERDKEKRLRLKGRIKQDVAGPYWFRTITGTMPDGRKTLVIWRKLTGNPEEDNLVLDEWFTKQGYSSKDTEFGLIYVNGGNNLENLKAPDDTWKVRLIEDDFQRLMFATEGK
jgi:adenine-specific DNA-methyltransferase